MANHEFPKVLRGYDMEVVETRLTELDEEVASLREQLTVPPKPTLLCG